MALPQTGPLSFRDFNTDRGRAPETQIDMDAAAIAYGISAKPHGMDEFRGRSAGGSITTQPPTTQPPTTQPPTTQPPTTQPPVTFGPVSFNLFLLECTGTTGTIRANNFSGGNNSWAYVKIGTSEANAFSSAQIPIAFNTSNYDFTGLENGRLYYVVLADNGGRSAIRAANVTGCVTTQPPTTQPPTTQPPITFGPIGFDIESTCIDTTGGNATISITNITGGSGTRFISIAALAESSLEFAEQEGIGGASSKNFTNLFDSTWFVKVADDSGNSLVKSIAFSCYVAPPTTQPPTTQPPALVYNVFYLGFGEYSGTDACNAPQNPYYILSGDTFSTATNLYSTDNGSTYANSGYYSNGSVFRYWDNQSLNFTPPNNCGGGGNEEVPSN